MVTGHSRGWDIYHDGSNWRYSDTDEVLDDSRPCKRCGRMPTKEGYDACLGYIKGAKSACCGHGIEEPYFREIVLGNEDDKNENI